MFGMFFLGKVQAFAAFPWAEPADEVLAWEVRWPKILAEIKAAQADVVCLQEVQFEPDFLAGNPSPGATTGAAAAVGVGETKAAAAPAAPVAAYRLPSWLDSLLKEEGYRAHFADQSGLLQMAERNERVLGKAAPVGNAVLYRTDRLELCSPDNNNNNNNTAAAAAVTTASEAVVVPSPVEAGRSEGVCNSETGKKAKKLKKKSSAPASAEKASSAAAANGGSSSSSSGTKDTTTRVGLCLQGRAGSALEGLLGPTAVFSVHLDATSEEQRCKQLGKCLSAARLMGNKHGGTRQVVVAGDFNSELWKGSCVEGFLHDNGGNGDDGSTTSTSQGRGGVGAEATSVASFSSSSSPTQEELARECACALRLTSDDGGGDGDEDGDGKKGDGDGQGVGEGAGGTSGGGVAPLAPPLHPSPEQMAAWLALRSGVLETCKRHRVRLRRCPAGSTRAAYDHGRNQGPCMSWRLDHILYSSAEEFLSSDVETLTTTTITKEAAKGAAATPSNATANDATASTVNAATAATAGLVCTQVWAGLEDDQASAASGLPNRSCPSDHLPVACSFKCSLVPSLALPDRQKLVLRWTELKESFASQKASLELELEVEVEALTRTEEKEAKEKAATAAAAAVAVGATVTAVAAAAVAVGGEAEVGGQKAKKNEKENKKKAKARPSEAFILLLGQHRRRRQALGAAQEAERVAAADFFVVSDGERDVAEELGLFGLAPPKT
jgi:hypothetical protein